MNHFLIVASTGFLAFAGCRQANDSKAKHNESGQNVDKKVNQQSEILRQEIERITSEIELHLSNKEIDKSIELGFQLAKLKRQESLNFVASNENESFWEDAFSRWRHLISTPVIEPGTRINACEELNENLEKKLNIIGSDCQKFNEELEQLKFIKSEYDTSATPLDVLSANLEINYRLEFLKIQDDEQYTILYNDYKTLSDILKTLGWLSKFPSYVRSNMPLLEQCPENTKNICSYLRNEIVNLRSKKNNLQNDSEASSSEQINKLLLAIQHKQELLSLAKRGLNETTNEWNNAVTRFINLERMLINNSSLLPYTEKEYKAVQEVFDQFGPLYITQSEQNSDGTYKKTEVSAKGDLPWAAYWYPFRGNELFLNDDSTLKKFDRLTGGKSSEFEIKRAGEFWSEWDGLCDAWAYAAIATREPKKSVSLNGINFSISDLKALLIKKYEGFQVNLYGIRYIGDPSTDGQSQDLRPEAFHRLVEKYIGEKGQAIGIDEDPGPQVWNRPLIKMSWYIQNDSEHSNAYIVHATPYLIKNRHQIDNILTSIDDIMIPFHGFKYRLYVDKNEVRDGRYRVIYGEWIKESFYYHPDQVFAVPRTEPSKPINPEIARNLKFINSLLAKSYE